MQANIVILLLFALQAVCYSYTTTAFTATTKMLQVQRQIK